MEIYLDNAATTKVADGVPEIMVQVMTRDYGNPSSKHTKGMEAETYVDNAREIIASVLKCDSKNILFTSGGTEANNQAIMSTAHSYQRVGKHIITTKIEHASIHEPIIALENEGYEVSYLPVDCQGHIIEGELLD